MAFADQALPRKFGYPNGRSSSQGAR
jgi:hypothetical protein